MKHETTTVRIGFQIIGWVHPPNTTDTSGDQWHAIPAGFAVTIGRTVYPTLAQATAALANPANLTQH